MPVEGGSPQLGYPSPPRRDNNPGVINVQTHPYNARGDGVRDDTSAIVSAIADAVSLGVPLYFPGIPGAPSGSKFYRITSDMNITGPLVIMGDGASSRIVNQTANLGIFTILDGVNDVDISRLQLESTGAVNVLGRGVVSCNLAAGTNGCRRIRIHHCNILCPSTTGIVANGMIQSQVHDNYISNQGTGEHGIYLSNSGANCTDVTIHDNVIFDVTTINPRIGIQLSGGLQINIHDNVITGFWWNILFANAAATVDSTIADNTLKGAGSDAIESFNFASSGCRITGNKIFDPARSGIRGSGGWTKCVFSGNVIRGAAQTAIRVNSSTFNTFNGNTLIDADPTAAGGSGDVSACIRLNSSNTDNTFMANVAKATVSSFLYAVSVGGGGTNVRNRFLTSELVVGRSGSEYDLPTDGGGLTIFGDAAVAWVVLANDFLRPIVAYFNSALTASRIYSIDVTSVRKDTSWLIVRSANATGAFNVDIKTSGGTLIKSLTAAGQWAILFFDGTNLLEVESGTL